MENKLKTTTQKKEINIKKLMLKEVSTLVGGIIIGSVALLFLLVVILICANP